VNVDDLTTILADRLAAIVPSGFHVWASDGMLWYSAEAGRFGGQQGDGLVGQAGTDVRTNYGGYGQDEADNLVGMAIQALDELQDYIDEAIHDPWPGTRTPPRPRAEVRGSMLHLWYGQRDNDDVVLACEPTPLGTGGRAPG
jgi:hypothetical protein